MSKELHCGDVVPGCDEVIRGETVEEVMEAGARHARDAHGMEEVDAETAEKVRAAIREV